VWRQRTVLTLKAGVAAAHGFDLKSRCGPTPTVLTLNLNLKSKAPVNF
jgi:hypothetical protein